jgi:excisionase family DNA binding protein
MELYTRNEAARLLRIGVRTIDRRIAEGALQCHRLGDGPRAPVRISAEQLAEYLKDTKREVSEHNRREAEQIISRLRIEEHKG